MKTGVSLSSGVSELLLLAKLEWSDARCGRIGSFSAWDNYCVTVREVVILGSTGSIGTQALEVIAANPERFRVVALAAAGNDPQLLAHQALLTGVQTVGVTKASAVQDVRLAFYAEAQRRGFHKGEFSMPKIVTGPDAPAELAGYPCDIVLNAITGSIGLASTMNALTAGHVLALANKESLVAGGSLVRTLAHPGQIVPVDSEHSALAQCLRSGSQAEVRRLVLTASGGPFRGKTSAELAHVTPEQAFAHPTWNMGPVVTINSATLVNKGLELIEAHELFQVDYDAIDVVVHPQSLIHSMVEFADGATIAQVSPPDMRLPIALALGWPDRVADVAAPLDWRTARNWQFEPVDHDNFPAIKLAAAAGKTGRCLPAIYNAANEECVEAFRARRLSFVNIVSTVHDVLDAEPGFAEPGSIDDVFAAEAWAREATRRLISQRAI